MKYALVPKDEKKLQQMLTTRDQLLEQLKVNVNRAQHYMNLFVDKHKRATNFNEGELVLVKLEPYRQHSVALQKN